MIGRKSVLLLNSWSCPSCCYLWATLRGARNFWTQNSSSSTEKCVFSTNYKNRCSNDHISRLYERGFAACAWARVFSRTSGSSWTTAWLQPTRHCWWPGATSWEPCSLETSGRVQPKWLVLKSSTTIIFHSCKFLYIFRWSFQVWRRNRSRNCCTSCTRTSVHQVWAGSAASSYSSWQTGSACPVWPTW